MSTHLRRTREISGPGVGGVALTAKPTQLRPPEWRILDRRAEMQRRQPYDAAQVDQLHAKQRLEFEVNGDARVKETAIQMKLKQYSANEAAALEVRRSKLRQLLQSEEQAQLGEAESTTETVIERQSKMREQARALKEQRESERAELAQTKLDQAWNANCEALRTIMSKKNHERIDMDRKFQVAQKQALVQQEAWVEQIYADSWEMDRLAKHARETHNLRRVRAESRHLTECLDAQVQLLEQNRAEERVLQQEEQANRFVQAKLIAEEEGREREIDAEKKRRLKKLFDQDVEQKLAETAARTKEMLDADLALIETLKQEAANVVAAEADKKQRLRAETESYLGYLRDMKAFEQEQERIRDQFLEAEQKKEAAKRRAQFRKERDARAGMMREVVHTLQEQMEQRWNQIMQARAEKQHEAQQIARGIADLNRQAEKKDADKAAANVQHRTELQHQIGEIAERQYGERMADAKLSEDMLANFAGEERKINAELDRIAHLDMSVQGTGF